MSTRNPFQRWQQHKLDRRIRGQIARVESFLNSREEVGSGAAPILIFNASTRIHRISLNAAYSLLTAWALRARGYPVQHLVCSHGMLQCVLGAHNQRLNAAPPCRDCLKLSGMLFPERLVKAIPVDEEIAQGIVHELRHAPVAELMAWEHGGTPFGALVLPGLRWVLRRHQLMDDETTRHFYRIFLASAVSLETEFQRNLEQLEPAAVVVFNGIFFPEAILRHVALQHGVRVITHEVGLQPFSAFFSHEHATFRQVDIGPGSQLSEDENLRLERYLGRRFQGEFSMAGIQFWKTMHDLPTILQQKVNDFSGMVPIFTNVIFDTSQVHANTLFDDMFSWLDDLVLAITAHQEILFVIRAHPDEDRPGKASMESVSEWFDRSGLNALNNVVFIPPGEELNSYQLIENAKAVLVYNSSVGLEASILGKPVLCAGRARYTQADTVIFPATRKEYRIELERNLMGEARIARSLHQENARRFLYDELYRASLDLSDFLQEDPGLRGMVTFRDFPLNLLLDSPALATIYQGVTGSEQFLLDA